MSDNTNLGALAGSMGIEITDEGSALPPTFHMPVAGNTQPYGALHGGATAVLVETAGSVIANRCVRANHHAVGIEVSVSHHRPATAGSVHATVSVAHAGSQLIVCEVVVVDDLGKRVATGRLTCMVVADRH
ncbi:PaaI family thioesterase [Rarobacter incanus]|uniref:Uncharacterized protein (TIGR00369 family) n=1 Tax=Rarobacter incanus TaxID=153494 RepID=A0A542SM93_9MICO|nr:PaaI family thioesterase [Rarobacter incanus]TQK75688.1 uncharacterized protein (TIGR00369 family) [Rarobacter incanus]